MICKPRKPLQVCGISLTDPTSKTVSSFYYDYQGRLIQSHRKEALGGDGHIHQSLTFTGKPSRTRETVVLSDSHVDSLVTERSYDGQERLVSETTSLNDKSQSVSYGYDEIGRLTSRVYGTAANPSALTETLAYNIREYSRPTDRPEFQCVQYVTPVSEADTWGGPEV